MNPQHPEMIFVRMVEAVFDDRRELFLELLRELLLRMEQGEIMPSCRCFNTELMVDFALHSNLIYDLEGDALHGVRSVVFRSIIDNCESLN